MTRSLADLRIRMQTLRLNHGQVAEVMEGTRLASGMVPSARHAMIRKLRRAFVPFGKGEIVKESPREELIYEFVHLAELGLAMKLLSEGMRFGHVVELVSRHRNVLRRFYKEALLEAYSGRGTPIPMTMLDPIETDPKTGKPSYPEGSGLYLDFNASQQNGILLIAEPRLLDPKAAISHYMGLQDGFYPLPLIALSQVCTRIEKVASASQPVRRGPKPRT